MAPRYPHYETQPYTGTLVDDSPIVTNAMLPFVGQLGPAAADDYTYTHGRRLAGLGNAMFPGEQPLPHGADPSKLPDAENWSDASLVDLEDQDDVVGSGVFDPGGPRGRETVNPDMGVFSTNPSIPGFIHRNPPYTVNTEVLDITNGGPTIEVAGGGLFYVERDGRLAPVATRRVGGGYVEYHPDGAPVTPVPWSPQVVERPAMKRVPEQFRQAIPPAGARIMTRPIVNAAVVSEPITGPVAGFGDDPPAQEAPGWGSWLVGGLVLGLAGGIAYETLKKR